MILECNFHGDGTTAPLTPNGEAFDIGQPPEEVGSDQSDAPGPTESFRERALRRGKEQAMLRDLILKPFFGVLG